MANIIIVHGVGGFPAENWFPWLKKELEKLGHNVLVPQFPILLKQTRDGWLEELEKHKDFLTPETIFVGHSLGVSFILSLLETRRAKAMFSVAGFVGKINNPFDKLISTFTQRDFDWEKIKNNCKHFTLFQSDNDPFVKVEKAQELSARLGVDFVLVKGAGHFNSLYGYKKFDLLLEEIKRFCKDVSMH